jgi:phosphatidylglycerol:prolipoprotein diacylglycerol transferase
MLTYPNIDPVALSLGPVKVHWYGLMYLLAFLCAWGLASYRAKQRDGWTADMVSDLVFYGALGVVLGGRIGYVLFYEFGRNTGHERFGGAAGRPNADSDLCNGIQRGNGPGSY